MPDNDHHEAGQRIAQPGPRRGHVGGKAKEIRDQRQHTQEPHAVGGHAARGPGNGRDKARQDGINEGFHRYLSHTRLLIAFQRGRDQEFLHLIDRLGTLIGGGGGLHRGQRFADSRLHFGEPLVRAEVAKKGANAVDEPDHMVHGA